MPKKRRRSSRKPRYSPAARVFVSREIEHLVRDRGYTQQRAIRAALSQARRAGYKVPSAPNVPSWLGRIGLRKRRSAKRKTTARQNPGVIIGDSALDLRYQGGTGKRKGKMRGPWKHAFESGDVQLIGRKDGSVLLKSKSGKRLWDHFEV